MASKTDEKTYIERNVNEVAKSIKTLKESAMGARSAITKTSATKITNYLRILVDNLGEDLSRLADTNVPLPGEFSLDAEIPEPKAASPTKPVYREAEPERLVGQRPRSAAVVDKTEDVSFIDD
jgi:hypothetical protein